MIVICAYDPSWKESFENLKSVFQSALSSCNADVDIQHVGSTSVQGLSAKPIIDIDIIINNRDCIPLVIEKLELLGYEHRGNMGIIDREAFRRKSEFVPFTTLFNGEANPWPKHNLYLCPADSISLKNHLVFRDYLRTHPEKVAEYSALKRQIVLENPADLDLYTERKTPFIVEILSAAGFDTGVLSDITEANRVNK